MGRITFAPLNVELTTDLGGSASLSVRVPGTFTGPTDDKNGRFLRYVELWPDSSSNGDRIYDCRIEDTDLILQGLGISGAFPSYPVLYYFQDQDIVETSTMKRGLFFSSRGPMRLEKIDPREPYDFVPSGMYLKATIDVSNPIPLGQKIRVNIGWGKNV